MMQWPGQFIGFNPNSLPLSEIAESLLQFPWSHVLLLFPESVNVNMSAL
jgi:hypothetical protein